MSKKTITLNRKFRYPIIVLRDVILIWILTGIGGFLVGFAASQEAGLYKPNAVNATAMSNILIGTLSFIIIGCVNSEKRWKHLLIVALFMWLTSIINVIYLHVPVIPWCFSVIAFLIMSVVGGGVAELISYVGRTVTFTEADNEPDELT